MKIQIALSTQIIPTEEAYNDRNGLKELKRFTESYLDEGAEAFDLMRGVHRIKTNDPNFILVARDSGRLKDVYLVDTRINQAVGFVEFEQQNVREVYTPHSYFTKDYRGKGYASMIYRWVLNSGITLLSEFRQSSMSNVIWKKLSKEYDFFFIHIHTLKVLDGPSSPESFFTQANKITVILGKGVKREDVAEPLIKIMS